MYCMAYGTDNVRSEQKAQKNHTLSKSSQPLLYYTRVS